MNFNNQLTPEEKLTVNSYNRNAREWINTHSDVNFHLKNLAQFKKHLPGGKILEIGCAGGRDAKMLIEAGYDYVGTDITEGFIEVARKNLPQAKFYQRSVYDLQFPDNKFDGFWASATLLHIPKSRIGEALKELHRVTRKNGVGFISLKQGMEQKVIRDDKGDMSRFFSFYFPRVFNKILKNNGFEILKIRKQKDQKTNTIWLIYLVRVLK